MKISEMKKLAKNIESGKQKTLKTSRQVSIQNVLLVVSVVLILIY